MFSHLDKILAIGGVIGLALYIGLLPEIHPDAAPSDIISSEIAIARATEFVTSHGYSSASFEWSAFLRRETHLLDTLGKSLGQIGLNRNLRDESLSHLPVYFWYVEGRRPGDQGAVPTARYVLRLSTGGAPWSFEQFDAVVPSADSRALNDAITGLADTLRAVPSVDSLLLTPLFFTLRPPSQSSQAPPPPPPRFNNPFFGLSRDHAIAMARYHFQTSLISQYPLAVDSVFRPAGFERDQIRVEFKAQSIPPGVPFRTSVDLYATGVLSRFESSFVPDTLAPENAESDQLTFDFSLQDLPQYLLVLAYVGMIILSFVLFIRRLSARLIDVKSAIQDAIWGAIFLGGAIANQMGWEILQDSDTLWTGLLFGGLFSLVSASLVAFFVFMISCGSDSISRFIWPEKVATLSMARTLQFRNIPMGRSLLHGLCVAGILLGIQTLFLAIPGVTLAFDADQAGFASETAFSPVLTAVFRNGGFTILYGLVVLLGIGSLLYMKWPRQAVAIAGVALIFMILQLGPANVAPAYLQWVISALIGFVVVVTFLRFDYLTAFMGLFVFGAVWELAPGWLLPSAGFLLDVWIEVGLLIGCLILAFVGLLSGNEFSETEQFIPGYLKEIAQQERLKSELDIATQVQASLLPHRMPEMERLDIAAMCLPAQEVGGDYFDFIQLDGHRLALIVGDVSGKGIQAAFYMTLTKGFIHAICRDEVSPARVLTRINDLFCRNAPRGTFISLIYGIFDTENNTFTFARAGHDPIIFRPRGRQPEFLKPRGMAIGLTASDTFETNIEDHTIELHPDDLIVFYTDGVTEASNPRREQFGTDRLAQMVRDAQTLRASMLLQNLSQQLQMFVKSAGRHDDMTLIVVRCVNRISEPRHSSDPAHA